MRSVLRRVNHCWPFVALTLATCGGPAAKPPRGEDPTSASVADDQHTRHEAVHASATPPRDRVPAWRPRPEDLEAPRQPLEDASGHALDAFYAKLARVDDDAPDTLARVTHLGDSSIGLDGLTHAIRTRMQGRFGDGGPGYLLLQRYSRYYKPKTVVHRANGNWSHCYIAYGCATDGHYGLGGVSFSSRGGASTLIRTRPESELGREISSVELWYAALPKGGRLAVSIDGADPHIIDTRADSLEDRWHDIDLEQGPHRVRVRAAGQGKVRAYGVVMETDGPGVVWDGVSMTGAFTKRLRGWDDEHIAGQLAHRDPDLLVMSYGGNDLRRVVAFGLTAEKYEREYDEVLSKLLEGKPGVACIVTSVIDHGRSGDFEVEPQHVETIVAAQRSVAARHGCAFFDTYQAMGGAGSIHAWRKARPRLAEPDLKHLSVHGREIMGENIFRALIWGYVDFRQRAHG